LLLRRPADDLTTAECRINNVILDGGAILFYIQELAQRLGLRIDKNNPPSLEGVSTDTKAIGLYQLRVHSQIKH